MKHISELLRENYYCFEFSGEGFEGKHFELNADECRAYFILDGSGDEYKFREKLERMDKWFEGKDYGVQKDALRWVAKWLRKD